jgi:hypothetical protein
VSELRGSADRLGSSPDPGRARPGRAEDGDAEPVRAVFTGWCRALDPDPVLPGPTGTAWADALAAIHAAVRAVHARFGAPDDDALAGVVVVPVWPVAVAVSAGRLLAPGWPDPTASN